ncbi:MAG TPA: hypothetical protein DCM54_12700 [Gammaproteobacteria bacterium]|nr:hypothetical protein [Gammaproteobacteria bacterium]
MHGFFQNVVKNAVFEGFFCCPMGSDIEKITLSELFSLYFRAKTRFYPILMHILGGQFTNPGSMTPSTETVRFRSL